MITINNGTSQLEISKPTVNIGTTMLPVDKVTVNDGTVQRLVWESWNGEIYDRGNIFHDLTGGWEKRAGSQIGASQIIYNSDNMMFQARKSNGYNANVIYSTVKPIDVSKYNKIKAIVDAYMPSWSHGQLLAVGGKHAYRWDKVFLGAVSETKNNWTIELDISSLQGEYPIQFSHGTSPEEPWTKIYKIWME